MVKKLNHVGISVVSLERSVEFYRTLFGMELVHEASFEGEQYEAILALKGAAGNVALLKSKEADLQLELFEFKQPKPKHAWPNAPVSDLGISHFCIEVTGIESEYERLKAQGMVFHCPPLKFKSGNKATYGRDPDGNVIELWQPVERPVEP